MKVREVMQGGVVTVTPRAPIRDAVRLMLDHRISGLPVVDQSGAPVGIVTEGDFVRRAELGTEKRMPAWRGWLGASGTEALNYVRSHAVRVGQVMTVPVVSVTPDTELAEVVALMESRRIKQVPVLENGRVAGIVTRADLLRELAKLLPAAGARPVADAQLRGRILASLKAQSWARSDTSVDLTVKGGIVELLGVVTDPRQREAIRVLAENMPGVRGVVDHLLWVERMSGIPMDSPAGLSQ
ncbi:MAG: CBS domain-containing protein [Proteobacteria bacterium]|nr:CBS domain-containing protein [Pseudomonadota bacterium]